ncbi:MAG: SDR family oxidoreductase [Chloroflexi bacterium]|nr:SDR family oxidoreductase [Chloroflexota bacterium]
MGDSLFSLAGKTAIVTGGKKGIGRAISLAFAGAGADLVICSRGIEDGRLQAVADEIHRLGRRCLAVQADITRRADVDNLARRAADEFGHIDILVNNAGNFIVAPLLELSEDDWELTFNTHLKGYYFCCQAVGKKMVEQKRGNIINIASSLAHRPVPGRGVYSIAKAGVVMMTRVLARELASYHIRVNAISPGLVRTELIEYLTGDPEALKQRETIIPLGHIAEPEQIASVALFLASEASSHVTGHTILVEGGELA